MVRCRRSWRMLLAGEPGDVAGEGEDLRGGDRAEAVDSVSVVPLAVTASRRSLSIALMGCVGPPQVAEQGAGDGLAPAVDGGVRSDGAEQPGGRVGAEAELGAAGVQVAEQDMEPVHRSGAFGDQVVASFGEQPQVGGVVLGRHPVQPVVVLSDGGDRCGVGDVGLARVPGAEQAGPGGERCRDVERRPRRRRRAAERSRAPDRWRLQRPTAARARPPPMLAELTRAGGAHSARSHDVQLPAGRLTATAVSDPLWGSIPIVISCVALRVGGDEWIRDGQPDFRNGHASVEPRRGGADRGRHALK